MTELLAVITITLLAVISPGPDFAMVTRNSLLLSRRAGVLTAVGIGLGVLVHVAYTLLGLGLLIQQSLWLFNAIKLLGAAYLVYLGLKMLRSQPASGWERYQPDYGRWRGWLQDYGSEAADAGNRALKSGGSWLRSQRDVADDYADRAGDYAAVARAYAEKNDGMRKFLSDH